MVVRTTAWGASVFHVSMKHDGVPLVIDSTELVHRRAGELLPARLLSIGFALLALVSGGCARLPSIEGRSITQVLEAPQDTQLIAAARRAAALHDGESGFHALHSGLEAFAARKALIDGAHSSLDVQYYIWRADMTGRLLLEALRSAADRNVRVRLLLDDTGTTDMDDWLRALAAHANFEIRLFNPFTRRSPRVLSYLRDFSRLNRRMHNKSLTADGAATIVGGRNVGDEYFDANDGLGFFDLDVLAIGPVVRDVSRSFDEFWNSDAAYPVTKLVGPARPTDLERLRNLGTEVSTAPAAQRYSAAALETALIHDLSAGALSLEWAASRVVADHPSKALGDVRNEDLLVGRLGNALGQRVERELDLITPYFVPMKSGVEMLGDLVTRGVKVRILTNSLEASDVPAVHAGYAHRRNALLKRGVELFELKRTAAPITADASNWHGSSGASLHAKTFAIDRHRIFVGSFNLDPRSAELNTELGILIDSGSFAMQLSDAFQSTIPAGAYRVRRDTHGHLEWVESGMGGEIVHRSEPGAGIIKRLWIKILSILPIERLL